MTKSVKEKERLGKIKECQLNGIPVPAELLKVKIMEIKGKNGKKTFRNRYKKKKRVNEYDFLLNNFKSNLKKYINKYIVDIANQIEVYEFEIRAMIYLNDPEVLTQIQIPYITLFINHKNKNFGYLTMEENQELDKYETYNGYNFFPCVFSNELQILDQKSQEYMTIFSCEFQFEESSFSKRFSIYKNKRFYHDISKLIITRKKFLSDIQISFKEPKPLKLFFHVSKEISVCWSANDKRYETCSIKNITEIDILKVFIGLGCIEINIPEEELIMKNIETIKNMILLSNY